MEEPSPNTEKQKPLTNSFILNECNICVEPFNKRNRMTVKCPYCEYVACRSCCQTYILNETAPRCMNPDCGKEWTLHFLRNAFTNTFLNTDLKTHREEVLFQQEVALLPATQPLVEQEIQRETIRKEIANINREVDRLRRQIDLLWREYGNVGNERPNAERNGTTTATTRAEFVRKCPATDCRGFLSTQWKCGICSKWTCPTCHEVKGEDRNVEHTCDPANVATAELLAQDTRHCPKCATPIFKIDGCDQMWCTQCHTGFSWRTGRVQTNVHNPHYFEWLRRSRAEGQPERTEGDFQCGRELTHRMPGEIERLLFSKTTQPIERNNLSILRHNDTKYMNEIAKYQHPNASIAFEKLIVVIRSMIHVNVIDRGRYAINEIRNNQDLRVLYLRNQLTAERFKVLVQQRHKKTYKHREIRNVIDIVVNTVTDIVYRFREYLSTCPQTECNIEMLDEIDRIREYANECLMDISHTYGSVILQFNENMLLVSRGS
jgi:hypothetical protein